jgi:endogenous inhibitor of DNA gyrase (YacG/DUF329 family)
MTGSTGKNGEAVRIVRCPRCGGDSVYAPTNRFRPFCSDRCKSSDLGAWASESYRLPAQPRAGDVADDDGELPISVDSH